MNDVCKRFCDFCEVDVQMVFSKMFNGKFMLLLQKLKLLCEFLKNPFSTLFLTRNKSFIISIWILEEVIIGSFTIR